ncbi:MAG: glycosyltransferase family 4 protein [Patescibacteria group bacterium]|nr:glycosyltransferase family 4 protein [Patescibacteria group bacterium]MDD4304317.1 glycosyltransferase family 4 protein [Patescibacteria group bacterium]MDD4695580.1 glycosyltransferase family 4 protein [Patescibacteria group bacterium]
MVENTKKISHIVCVFPPYNGGIGTAAQKQAKIGQKFGYNVSVYTPNYQKTGDIRDVIENIDIYRLNPKFTLGNAGYINISKYLKDADIIHLHYPFYFSMIPVILFAKKHKIKVLTFWHMNPKDVGLKGLFFVLYEKFVTPWIFKNSDKTLVSTSDYFLNSSTKKLFEKNKNKIQELAFSVNTENFKPREKNFELIEKYNLIGKKVCIFVGGLDRAHYFKGLEIILHAFTKLNDNYRLLVVGIGDMKEYYKNLTKELKIEEKIIFLDSIQNNALHKYYNLADCLILASINQGEAFGIVQLEAMSSAIPVIASDLPGVRTVLKDNETGFTFKTGNANDLSDKIKKLFETEDLLIKFGNNARERVLENYSDEIISQKLNSIYENMLNK